MHQQLEALLQAGQNAEVLVQAERIQRELGRYADPVESIWIAVWACRAAGGLQQWGQSVTWADVGLELAGCDLEAEGILRFSAARALMYIGDLLRAERELHHFLRLAARYPRLERVSADALYNLGHLERLLGRAEAATESFSAAEQAYTISGRRLGVALSRYEKGWTLLLVGRPEEAVPCLTAVEAELPSLCAPELAVDMAVARALYHSLIGAVAASDRLCEDLLETADLPHRQRAEVDWLLGTNALQRGDLVAAAEHMALAHQAAVADWWPPQMDRVNRLHESLLARQGPGR